MEKKDKREPPHKKDTHKQRGEELGQSSEILVVVDQRRAHRKKSSSYDCSWCGVVLVYAIWSIALWLPQALNTQKTKKRRHQIGCSKRIIVCDSKIKTSSLGCNSGKQSVETSVVADQRIAHGKAGSSRDCTQLCRGATGYAGVLLGYAHHVDMYRRVLCCLCYMHAVCG